MKIINKVINKDTIKEAGLEELESIIPALLDDGNCINLYVLARSRQDKLIKLESAGGINLR